MVDLRCPLDRSSKTGSCAMLSTHFLRWAIGTVDLTHNHRLDPKEVWLSKEKFSLCRYIYYLALFHSTLCILFYNSANVSMWPNILKGTSCQKIQFWSYRGAKLKYLEIMVSRSIVRFHKFSNLQNLLCKLL